jgi:Ca-activated chloride channel family protein
MHMRKMVTPAIVGLALAISGALVVAQGAAPAPSQPPSPQGGQAIFKSGVEVVTISVAVRDDAGRVVRGLKKTDFEVFDSGIRREMKDFYVGDSPISLALLLDISGSMAVGGNIERAREAALFTFDSELREVVSFTSDVSRIHGVSLKGKPWGKTSLYDAVAESAQAVARRSNRHRALLVITDGVDTGSKMSAPQVSGIASSIDVPVYLLRVVNPLDHPGGELEVIETDGRTVRTATLADLARWTGGDMRTTSVPAHTSVAIQDLFEELRYQYVITIEPGARPGWHPIEIRARKKDLVVHARGGYIAGPSRIGS